MTQNKPKTVDEIAAMLEKDMDKIFGPLDESQTKSNDSKEKSLLDSTNNIITEHSIDIAFKQKTLTSLEIDQKTIYFLKEARKYEVDCYDYTHKCDINECEPRSVIYFKWKKVLITRQNCRNIGLNPDIFYCRKGLFHDCGENCPGETKSRSGCCSCLKTGISKGSLFSAFETEKKGYFDSAPAPAIRVYDNTNDNHRRLVTESFDRDKKLNDFAFEFLQRFKKPKEIDISIILNKNDRLKYSTRQILEKCNWLGGSYEEITRLLSIFLLKDKCFKQDRKRGGGVVENNPYPKTNAKGDPPKKGSVPSVLKKGEPPKKRRGPRKGEEEDKKGYYILSYEIFKFLNNLTKRQIVIQYGIISISDIISKTFKGKSVNRKYEKKATEILNLVKVAETLFLKGMLPGIARLFNQVGPFFEYQKHLICKGNKYIDRCKQRGFLVDLNRYFFLTSFDSQKNCEKELDDCMGPCKEFWKPVRNFAAARTDLTSFPTFEEIRMYINYIIAIYTLVKTSGSFKGKRRTIDPSEIVIGAMDSLSTGYSIYKKHNSHDLFIPKIKKLSMPGYLPFRSEFSFITKIKQTLSASHKAGLICIKNAVKYHSMTGWSAMEMRKYILNFGRT